MSTTDTMSTTDNQVLTEILETLKGLSPPPILTDINKSIKNLSGSFDEVVGKLNTDLTLAIGTVTSAINRVIYAIGDSTAQILKKLEPNIWLEGLNLALGVIGVGLGLKGTATGTAIVGDIATLAGGLSLGTIGLILAGILTTLGLIYAVSKTPLVTEISSTPPKYLTGDNSTAFQGSYYNGANIAQSKPVEKIVKSTEIVSGVAPKVTPTSLPYSRYLNSGMSNTSVEKVKKSTETTRKTVLGIIPKTSQIVLPDTKQVALPITKQIATNANQASGLAVNIPNNQPLVSNDKNISPVTFNTIMSACNSSNGAKGSSSTSNTNSTHHHQNVYNIANIDIADGMISDLEDLIQAINRHAC